MHVHVGTVFVGGDDAGLWRLRDGALEPVTSFRDAPTRADWYTPWGGPPSVLSMASHGDDLYVGVHVGGILRSGDGGETWTDTIDLHVDVHEVVVNPDDGVVWAATGEQALAASPDRGRVVGLPHRGAPRHVQPRRSRSPARACSRAPRPVTRRVTAPCTGSTDRSTCRSKVFPTRSAARSARARSPRTETMRHSSRPAARSTSATTAAGAGASSTASAAPPRSPLA